METLLQSILTAADMRRYLPENLRQGLKGGVFFGLTQHTVWPGAVGQVECTALSSKTFGAKGDVKIDMFRIDEKFDAELTLTGDTSATVVEKIRNLRANLGVIPQSNRITYLYKGQEIEATIVQTFENQSWHSGSYVEFWVTHNLSPYPNFNLRLWWERT